MNIASRTKDILIDPASEWVRIEDEPVDPTFLFGIYAALLALIPALSGFIGACVIGVIDPRGEVVRTPIFDGFVGAVSGYAAAIFTIVLLGLVINLLAPLFGGRRNFGAAFKLAVYSYTPVLLAGIFLLLPGLHFLLLTGFYGAYILWLGLPRLMKASLQKRFTFAGLIVVCAWALAYMGAVAQRALTLRLGF